MEVSAQVRVLRPQSGVDPERRTAELTVAILQLVASRRGVAALPSWELKNYVDYDSVVARRIGPQGLWSDLYASTIHAKGDSVPALYAGFFDDRQEYMLRNPGWDHSAGMIPDKRSGSGSLKSHKSE